MLEADYIYMHTLLGTGDKGRMERAVNEILRHQNEDGGWSLYPGGPSNVNYGVKCYLALKLMGWTAEHPRDGEGAEEGAGAGRRDRSAIRSPRCISARWGSTTTTRCRRFRRRCCCFRTGSTSIFTRSARGRGRSWCRCRLFMRRSRSRSWRRSRGLTSCLWVGAPTADLHLRWDRKHIFSWRNFFLFTDRMVHWVRAGAHPAAAQDGAEEGRAVDAGAL